MLGRPASCEPVWKNVMAGSWLIASVCSDLMKHRSSTTFAVWGSNSLTHAPHWPCRANLKIDPASGRDDWLADIVVSRCPMRTDPGNSWPFKSVKLGLLWD